MNKKDMEEKMRDVAEITEASKPLIKLLAEKYNPHTVIHVHSGGAELLQGVATIINEEFIKD